MKRRLGWAPLATSSLLWVATLVFFAKKGGSAPGGDPLGLLVVIASAMAVFAVVGGIIASRTDNVLGWIFGGVAVLVSVKAVTSDYVQYGHFVAGGHVPAYLAVAWVSNWIWIPAVGTLGTFLFLLFPTGHPPSRRWRIVGWLAVVAMTSSAASVAFGPGPSDDFPYITNPVPIPALGFLAIGWPLLVLAIAASVASLVVRARRGSPVERKQIRWIAFAGTFFAAGFAASVLVPSITYWYVLIFVPVAGIAIACGVAIQRYRLYDIDRIISRTASYTILVALLGGIYAGLVIGFGRLLNPVLGASDLVVAVSTLVVAALFRPVQRRVQAVIDRRFNRARYDAARTIDTFAARLREQIDIDALGAELEGVAHTTMQPSFVSLWTAR